jgi:hypothetical protein
MRNHFESFFSKPRAKVSRDSVKKWIAAREQDNSLILIFLDGLNQGFHGSADGDFLTLEIWDLVQVRLGADNHIGVKDFF